MVALEEQTPRQASIAADNILALSKSILLIYTVMLTRGRSSEDGPESLGYVTTEQLDHLQ
jgi:hypothetical protein